MPSIELVAGANMPLPAGAVTITVRGSFDLSVLLVGADGRVGGDADFVFYNQPAAPGVRLTPAGVRIETNALRTAVERVVVVASPEQPGTPFGAQPPPQITVADSAGRTIARLTPTTLRSETAALLAELYRRGQQWKVRAIGQGYVDGLAGLARDFGVDVAEPTPSRAAAPSPAAPSPASPSSTRPNPAGPNPSAPNPAVPRSTPRPPAPPAPPPSPPRQPRPPSQPGPPTPMSPPDAGLAEALTEVIALTNEARAVSGLRPLAPQPQLAQAAAGHSADMAARDFFAHENPDGQQVSDRVLAVGYAYRKVAENVAAGQRTPAEVVAGWLDSPGHRRNILDPELTEIGVGRALGGSYLIYWTQVFGTRR